jgi:hypothetical protein
MTGKRNTIHDVLERLIICEPSTLATGCWEWPGGKTCGGYGKVTMAKKTRIVHKLAYEHLVGSVPDGLQLDHLCRNPCCANVEHLEPVTGRENLMRGTSFSALNARKTHCPQGHELAGANLLVSKGARICRTCKREKGRRADAKRGKYTGLGYPIKSHCPAGHEYAGDNLYVNPMTGKRFCKECRNASGRRCRARRGVKG